VRQAYPRNAEWRALGWPFGLQFLLVFAITFWWLLAFPCTAQDVPDSPTLTLSDAIALGLEHNPSIREAEIELELAQLEWEASVSSFLLPTVGFDLSLPDLTTAGWSGGLAGDLSGGLSVPIGSSGQLSGRLGVEWDVSTNTWAAGDWSLSYSQRIDLSKSGNARDEIDALREAIDSAEAALEEARANVVADVALAFVRLLSEEASLERAVTDLDDAGAALAKAQADFDAGVVSESTTISARISCLDAEIAVADREASLAESRESFFAVELGLTDEPELVAPVLDIDRMKEEAGALLCDEAAAERAVASADGVENAEEALADAEDSLQRKRLAIDPGISIQAGLSANGFSVSWGVSLTLFSPGWSEAIAMAELEVELAEERLRTAVRQSEATIRGLTSELADALREFERLPLEEERWALEEQVMSSKLAAGSIGDDDWREFAAELESFRLDASERAVSLLAALLEYRSALGLALEWEKWVQ